MAIKKYYRITKAMMKFVKEKWIALKYSLSNFKKLFLSVLYNIKLCLLNEKRTIFF